ncbi:glycoside hydrolase family 3 N-terminal domain-containing protein [Protaetiibacter larvae]|uniref:Glycoside hydrolase family 3 protein n=1 Tax=Protaetiibacter larvae TaxID=2592654 RepID=A0A5C1Y7B3_9MICO|nr:glycoside hydrolase family 3 N-terminal domain-containing protein [Protaetiibacter larvae]QEO09328.1 glycoside hydrolase family 3 protein [Protaetiibacter larvae]
MSITTGSTTQGGAVLLPGFVGTELPPWLEARLRRGLAGVCLFAANIVSPDQLRALTAAIRAANPHALIAIDEEGGDVSRLYAATGSPFPGNAVLGRLDDASLTASVGAAVARELRAAGVNLNFAPDVDINSNPDNPVIGVRSFGTDPALVARHAAAWIAAHEAEGVAVSAKHFPGHGDTAQDSHHALPVVDLPLDTLRARELVPFVAAVAAGARTIMSSHILLPQLDATGPATFSARILGELLRGPADEGGLGFTGVIVSDALDMAGASGEIGIPAAAVRALAAGCDLLCIGTRNTDEQLVAIEAAIGAALADGTLATERLADAEARVGALAASLPGDAIDQPPAFAVDPARVAQAFDIADGVLPLPAGIRILSLETTANMAVGPDVPWGLASVGVEPQRLHEGDALPASDAPYLIVGKDNHRRAWTRDLIDRARAAQPGSVVIDMGWPAPDRRYADIATFGASRSVSDAVRSLLEGTEQ